MLSVFLLIVIMPSVTFSLDFLLNVIILSVIMLSVIMLTVILPNVAASSTVGLFDDHFGFLT
jgi:hypothetical protein